MPARGSVLLGGRAHRIARSGPAYRERAWRRCTRGSTRKNCATGKVCFPSAWMPRCSSSIELAPWLAPAFEPELRVCMRDATFTPLIAELSKVPALGELPEAYERIRERLRERLSSLTAAVSEHARCPGTVAPAASGCRARRGIATGQPLPKRRGAGASTTSTTWTSASCSTKIAQLLRIGYNVDDGSGAINPATICWRPKPGPRFSWRSPKATSRARPGSGWDASSPPIAIK